MRRLSILLFAVLFLCSVKLHAQCESEQKILKDIQEQYNVLFVDLEKQGELLKKQVPDSSDLDSGFKSPNPHLKFIVKFDTKRFVFDLIEVTMKQNTLSFDVPRVTMKTKSFSIPYSKTEIRVTEICCGIKTKTVVVTNGMKRVETKLPEIKMVTTEVKTKIPEFRKTRKEIKFDVPEFTLVSPIPESGPGPDEEKFKGLQAKAKAIAVSSDSISLASAKLEKEQKAQSATAISNLYHCMIDVLKSNQSTANEMFTRSLIELDGNIQEVRSYGLDPAAIKDEKGNVTNLIKVRDELLQSHGVAENNIIAAIEELKKELERVLKDLNS